MGTHLREQLMTARVSYRVELLIREAAPPEGEVAVEWILVTTPPIGTPEEMRRVVEYYCVRWAIGVFFRTLKSGCRIGERRFEDVERVLPCLALCNACTNLIGLGTVSAPVPKPAADLCGSTRG